MLWIVGVLQNSILTVDEYWGQFVYHRNQGTSGEKVTLIYLCCLEFKYCNYSNIQRFLLGRGIHWKLKLWGKGRRETETTEQMKGPRTSEWRITETNLPGKLGRWKFFSSLWNRSPTLLNVVLLLYILKWVNYLVLFIRDFHITVHY